MSIEWALLTFGIALLLVGLVGRVKVKGIEVGTGTTIARLGVGLTGLMLVYTHAVWGLELDPITDETGQERRQRPNPS